jgi:hypothetical protein
MLLSVPWAFTCVSNPFSGFSITFMTYKECLTETFSKKNYTLIIVSSKWEVKHRGRGENLSYENSTLSQINSIPSFSLGTLKKQLLNSKLITEICKKIRDFL